jgi:hypothetical protein
MGANCSANGATGSSYTLASSDVGHTITVTVTATNGNGPTSATSPATASISAPGAPTNTALPAITGTPKQGQTLSASTGNWTGSPTSYSYIWYDCDNAGANCKRIPNQHNTTYTLVAADVGHTIRVLITATNTGGSTQAASRWTATTS